MPEEKALNEELEALQLALKTEEDGYQYYTDASQRSQHPLVKKFFAAVANDERGHVVLIKDFYKALKASPTGDVKLPDAPADYKKRLKTIFENARKEIKGTITPDTGILDVYRHSMDLETKAANFYKERAQKTKHQQVKKLWDWLFLFESDHYRMFSETLSYLEKPDLWHLEFEKAFFEG